MATLINALSPLVETPAVIIPTKPVSITLSHKELSQQVLKLQKKLARVGITHKDAVAIVLPNSLEFAVAFLAISLQRAACAPLNPAYKEDEFEFYLDDLNAALVLIPRGTVSRNGEIIMAAKKCNCAIAEVYWNGTEIVLDVAGLGELHRSKQTVYQPEPEDVALILHTSGTTGRPKAVPLTHRNLCTTMVNIKTTYKLTTKDRNLLVMPLFHVHGLLAAFLAPLMSGGSCIIPLRFSATEFWNDFITHSANWYTAVPTIHLILLKTAIPSPMPPIRFIRSCSSPLSPTVHKQLELTFGAPVLEAYAMTEAAHQMTSNPLPPASRKPGSVGIPQGIALQILDEDGQSMSQGQIGEVCVLGPNVTSGYLGDPAMIASPFTKSGFLRTGDQGYLDQDGYLFLTGRIKELINKGGEKISPIEIDNLLSQHPSVAEAVSFAIEDELYGQNVAAAIVLNEGSRTTKEEISEWFGQRAAKFKIPKIYFTTTMPKTATGKIQRRQVAKAMAETEKSGTLLPSPESPTVMPSAAKNAAWMVGVLFFMGTLWRLKVGESLQRVLFATLARE